MVNYGSIDYWNERYTADEDNPFDWLCDYEGVRVPLEALIEDRSRLTLMVGCGNAPFSPDLFKNGFVNLINTDLSDVVISQMRKRYPEMNWEIMDVLDLKFPDNHFPYVLDKSLVDTLMCYNNR